jgi:hypothetical protein
VWFLTYPAAWRNRLFAASSEELLMSVLLDCSAVSFLSKLLTEDILDIERQTQDFCFWHHPKLYKLIGNVWFLTYPAAWRNRLFAKFCFCALKHEHKAYAQYINIIYIFLSRYITKSREAVWYAWNAKLTISID